MGELNKIKRPISRELELFEAKFKAAMKSKTPLLDKITHYIIKRKGKQVRPMFVFYSARMFGETTESSFRAAALIELLHTATLVHDDVVDDAYQRRGFFSINALWKNKIAVLVGDYLLSKGLLLSLDNDEFQLLKIVSEAVRDMSEGELLQVEKARSFDYSEEMYYEVIRMKTASLFAACCAAGAASAGVEKEMQENMKKFGATVGLAFQIKDDLFEFGVDDVGKPRGIDIKERKATLPLIYALKNAEKKEKRRIISLIKSETDDMNAIQDVIAFTKANGGTEYAEKRMHELVSEAEGYLHEIPDSEFKQGLKDLVSYTINRKK